MNTIPAAENSPLPAGLPHVAVVLLWYPLFTQPFIFREVEQLRRSPRFRHEPDLWNRVGHLLEVRDDLRVTAHVLQRRSAGRL